MQANTAFEPKYGETERYPKRDDRNCIDAVPRVTEVRSGGHDEIALLLDGELERQVNVVREGGPAELFSRVHAIRIDIVHTA
jgi:hypothetical protein